MAESSLDELVVRYLERLQTVGDEVLDELCRAHPECDRELRARIDVLRRLGFELGASGAEVDRTLNASVRRALFRRWFDGSTHTVGGESAEQP